MNEEPLSDFLNLQYALLIDPHTGQEFNLSRFATSIGRSISCDVVVTDKSVSRQHAIITCIKGKFFIEDVGSTNGTSVNGKGVKVGRVELKPGDEIRVGLKKLILLMMPDQLIAERVFIEQAPTTPTAAARQDLRLAKSSTSLS